MAVTTTHARLEETRCDYCFLLAPLKEVHRSKCRTKNYCTQVCRDTDDAVHNVCCNPDKTQRYIDERKVKIGGKDKVVAANAVLDNLDKNRRSNLPLFNPAERKTLEKALEKTRVKLPKKKKTKKNQIDEVD